MRMVFMGSAAISCVSLERVLADGRHRVVGAVTQPDRPRGRNLSMESCPARRMAEAEHIPVLAPPRVNDPEVVAAIAAMRPDLIAVVAFGQILRRELLLLPPQGCINVHASLLPAYRGAAPIQWAVACGETETGVTVQRMAERMDAGDLLLQERIDIGREETAGELHDRLAVVAARALAGALDRIDSGVASYVPQDESKATYAPKLSKQDGRLDWTKPAVVLYDRVRGFNPWPMCHTTWNRGGCGPAAALRVLKARVESGAGMPGAICDVTGDGPLVACGEGALRLLDVQPEGGRIMSGAAFLRGHGARVGDRMGFEPGAGGVP